MPENLPSIFDLSALRRARERAERLNGDRFLDRAAAEGISERLSAIKRHFKKAMMLDVPEGVIPVLEPHAEEWTFGTLGETETVPLWRGKFDLIVSVMALQSVNDLPGVLIQICRALTPDGLFVGALLGGGTAKELRDAFARAENATRGGISPRVSPFADVRDLGALLQRAGFALPVADVERLVVRYRDFFGLVRDLRAHGLTNVMAERSRVPLRRDTLDALLAQYAADHADPDGRLRATFETLYLTGWAPHESQQKPLSPGSAKARLADALGTDERPLRDRN